MRFRGAPDAICCFTAPGDVEVADNLQGAVLEELGSWTVKELYRRDVCDGLRAWLRRRHREYSGAADDRFRPLIRRHRDQLWREFRAAFERRDGFDPRLNPTARDRCRPGADAAGGYSTALIGENQ